MLIYKVVFNDEELHYVESLEALLDVIRFYKDDEEWDLGDISKIEVDDISQEEFDNLHDIMEY